MKISILTFSKETNYGANLQCYALCKTFQEMGHHVDIIDIQLKRKKMPWYSVILSLPTIYLFNKFRIQHLNYFTRKYKNIGDLIENCPNSNLFVVGSDQVWNPQLTKRLDPLLYFFSFLPEGAHRISYAASFGTEMWNHSELTSKVKELLNKFDAVSVREEAGADICKNDFGIEAKLVIDPTLLLHSYDNICGKYDTSKETNDLTYFTFVHSSSTQKILADFSKLHNLNAVVLRSNRSYPGFKRKMYVSVAEWLNSIRYSKIVITTSFHCMVFCILFHKRFVAVPGKSERSSRQIYLLKLLGLSKYYCSNISALSDILTQALNDNIDYSKVDSVIESLRKQSMSFLYTTLTSIK